MKYISGCSINLNKVLYSKEWFGMKYKDFMSQIVISDALLDRFDKDEIKVCVSEIKGTECILFYNKDEVVNCIIMR